MEQKEEEGAEEKMDLQSAIFLSVFPLWFLETF